MAADQSVTDFTFVVERTASRRPPHFTIHHIRTWHSPSEENFYANCSAKESRLSSSVFTSHFTDDNRPSTANASPATQTPETRKRDHVRFCRPKKSWAISYAFISRTKTDSQRLPRITSQRSSSALHESLHGPDHIWDIRCSYQSMLPMHVHGRGRRVLRVLSKGGEDRHGPTRHVTRFT